MIRQSSMSRPAPGQRRRRRSRRAGPDWHQPLAALRRAMQLTGNSLRDNWPSGREVLYIIDAPRTRAGPGLLLEIACRERKKDGQWGKPKKQAITSSEIPSIPDPRDREALSLLMGAKSRESYPSYYYSHEYYDSSSTFRLQEAMLLPLIRRMCQTGRCLLRTDPEADPLPLTWDEGGAWELWVVARKDEERTSYILSGELRRGEQRMPLHEPTMLDAGNSGLWTLTFLSMILKDDLGLSKEFERILNKRYSTTLQRAVGLAQEVRAAGLDSPGGCFKAMEIARERLRLQSLVLIEEGTPAPAQERT